MNSVREIQLGMQKYDKQRDSQNPFEESEDVLKDTLGPDNPRHTARTNRISMA